MDNPSIRDHFTNPRNVGEIPGADGIGTYGDPDCGDYLVIYLKVNRGNIVDIKYKIFGCSTLIALTSMLTEMVKGKVLEEVRGITGDDILEALGGVPEDKTHCARLCLTAFYLALQDYKKKKRLGWARG